jgi:hypothetical protein
MWWPIEGSLRSSFGFWRQREDYSCRSEASRCVRRILVITGVLLVAGCGYRFSGGPSETPFPPDVRTIVIRSATNNTTVTGIETELTNDLRGEFALGQRLKPVRSDGDVILNTVIATYRDTPATYKADGKELTRIGTLKVLCNLMQTAKKKVLWKRNFAASYSYLVTDSITETLSNRRRAISRMIQDIIIRIHRSLYEVF